MAKNYIFKRGENYQYRRRVPSEVAHLDERKEVKISLKTKNYTEAIVKAEIYNNQIENFWKALVQSGTSENASQKYKAAVQLAKAYGFAYKTTDQIAASTINEIVGRLSHDLKSKEQVESLLGGVKIATVMLSECTDQYFKLVADRLAGKNEHKITKWKNPRAAAMRSFIEVVGDKPIHEVNREDVLSFKNWWLKQIENGLSADSANKEHRFVRDILQTVTMEHQLEIDFEAMFKKIRFHYTPQSRPPFEASYVQNVLLPGLKGLSQRDRMVMYAMADTGARESEIFGLLPDEIILDGDIPFIWIRPRENYKLKTKTSERQIPLVGTALYAFKQFPKGFAHEGNPDTFSNIANKYLTENKLKPTIQHSAYSLRHTFKDRLRDVEASEEIIDSLMGHKKTGPKYGRGHKLETKHKWLSQIAYKVPV